MRSMTLLGAMFTLPLLVTACSGSDTDEGTQTPFTPPVAGETPEAPPEEPVPAEDPATVDEGQGAEGVDTEGNDTNIPLEGGEQGPEASGGGEPVAPSEPAEPEVPVEPTTPAASGPTSDVEDPGTDCAVPALPAFAQLPNNPAFPDPFTMLDGTAITTRAQWVCRRAEISAQLQRYELGQKPPKPESVVGTAGNNSITVQVSEGGRTLSFTASIQLPTTGTAPFPAMVGLGAVGLPNNVFLGQGVALINFNHGQIAAQSWGAGVANGTRGVGSYYDFYDGRDNDGAMLAWAWGVSRLIDALETTPAAQINADRVGITGCSRNGKGALMIGALDARIALTIPQESGSGGVAAWRASEEENNNPATRNHNAEVQRLESTFGEQPWFSNAINQFGGNVNRLPIDHHEVVGMVAPRGLLAFGNRNEDWNWLGQYNANQGMAAGRKIYQALGAEANVGFAESGHNHCGQDFNGPEVQALDAFVRKFLLDQTEVDTGFFATRYPLDEAKWVNWQTPTLSE